MLFVVVLGRFVFVLVVAAKLAVVFPVEVAFVLALGGRSFCTAAFLEPAAVAVAGFAATTPGPLNTPGFELAATAGWP